MYPVIIILRICDICLFGSHKASVELGDCTALKSHYSNLIKFNSNVFHNSVTDRWSAPKVKSQDEEIEETAGKRISSSHKEYEKRRMSRIEERRAELEKLASQKEAEERDRRDRIEKRRMERY